MVRIVPSPDWFVGVDSLDLCEGSRWKEQVALDLYPHDAGTDSGFTFSSPNFATIPQDTVTEVGRPEALREQLLGRGSEPSMWLLLREPPGPGQHCREESHTQGESPSQPSPQAAVSTGNRVWQPCRQCLQ